MAALRPRFWIVSIAGLAGIASPGSAAAASLFLDGFEAPPTFSVMPPALSIAPGELRTSCYYFRAPATPQSVRRITSLFDTGVAHLIVYATYDNDWTPQERQPPGTLETDCSLQGGLVGWLHVAHAASAQTRVPADDGTGRAIALPLAADQPLVLQMRVVNASDETLQPQVELMFESWHPALDVTPSASYITDNIDLSIPPGATDVESRTCATPAGTRFWRFTARTHALGTRVRLLDGSSVLLDGTDWEHPPVVEYDPPGFFTFGNALTYECTYSNSTGGIVRRGDDETSDEVCMGVGWFFPAERPMVCVGDIGPL